VWTEGLSGWFRDSGRHDLPWRLTTDPWAVLVSEVMLQQTSVARVLPRWARFLSRWPAAADCATASLDEVLREWQGLGYPRRARALWLCAAHVAAEGWPRDEAGLRALPGIGVYTARALLAFSSVGEAATEPPRDVNLGRVAARAALGCEPHEVAATALDAVLRAGRPARMSLRDYSYALFDTGALHCRARPQCDGCPLRDGCAWRARDRPTAATPARRQAPYPGSLRQLRGAVLSALLESPQISERQLLTDVGGLPGATAGRVRTALEGLVADGLIPGLALPGAAVSGVRRRSGS
jgi:A/G-specific adenine glycosylase